MTTLSTVSGDISKWPREPYKGLNYFSAADAPLFGQRDDDIDEVTALLSNFDVRILLLHGGTGAGKSSFLRAGLIPRLERISSEFGRNFFFLREARKDGALPDPLLVRATDDPIARIFETLLAAARLVSLPESARQGICQALVDPIPRDRLKAVPSILRALKALTASPQRDMFVLVIDQAEEVLTLPNTGGSDNARNAFFELLEQICLGHLDLRVIVVLRTEYYGRFCSFFMVRPTSKLTPVTEPRVGLFDYLLRGLRDGDLAGAIRQPTLAMDNDPPPPHPVYGFTYEDDLPEIIAADLVRHSGEASPLSAMQIVCKQLYENVILSGRKVKITKQDYIHYGRAEGAIEAFLFRSLHEAAAAARLPPLSNAELDSWVLVLSHVVGRTAGGTTQTLIASEHELLAEAEEQKITRDKARLMLSEMVHPDRRLLRFVGGQDGTYAYSLGHDSLGPSLLRRRAEAAVRAEERAEAEARLAREREIAERERIEAKARLAYERETAKRRIEQIRYRSRLAVVIVTCGIVLLALTAFMVYKETIAPLQRTVDRIEGYAARARTNDFRLRLLLLAAALQRSDTRFGSLIVDVESLKEAARNVLLRSPVYGGTFDGAGWDADGQRVFTLIGNKVVVHDLVSGNPASGNDEKPKEISEYDLSNRHYLPPSVGSVKLESGSEALVVFRSESGRLYVGGQRSPLKGREYSLPSEFVDADAKRGKGISRVDILGSHLRITYSRWSNGAITRQAVVRLSGSTDLSFKSDNSSDPWLDWTPDDPEKQGVRQPILAEDCERYVFQLRNQQDNPDFFTLWLGKFDETKSQPIAIHGILREGAVTVARGCGSIFVRDDGSEKDAPTLHILSADKPQKSSELSAVPLTPLPAEFGEIIIPSVPLLQPMFAAAPFGSGRHWRVGWATPTGLALVDVGKCSKDSDAVAGRDLCANPSVPLKNNQVMLLTGLESQTPNGTLSLSPDGSYAFMTVLPSFAPYVEVRAFNLNFATRGDALAKLKTAAELVREACRVAKLHRAGNKLSTIELENWLDQDQEQPCDGGQ